MSNELGISFLALCLLRLHASTRVWPCLLRLCQVSKSWRSVCARLHGSADSLSGHMSCFEWLSLGARKWALYKPFFFHFHKPTWEKISPFEREKVSSFLLPSLFCELDVLDDLSLLFSSFFNLESSSPWIYSRLILVFKNFHKNSIFFIHHVVLPCFYVSRLNRCRVDSEIKTGVLVESMESKRSTGYYIKNWS